MYLRSLSLKNFRNYSNQTIDFHSTFNFIFGKNAQGKTNLLEAIYFLGHLKSFRTAVFDELISKESKEPRVIHPAVIESSLMREGLDHEVRIVLEDGKKGVWLNQKRPSLYRDYHGLIPVILFEPWEVYLFRESPSMRRKFLDRAVFLDYSPFLKIAREYETVVVQKNKLLKDLRDSRREFLDDDAELEVWNEKLASLGSEVVFCRLRWMEKVNRFLSDEYRLISKGTEEMNLSYVSTCSWENFEKNGDKADIYRELVKKIKEKGTEEKQRCESLIGPHRDDWLATLGNRPLGTMGSQGENRCGIIAIKSIQVKIYREEKGFPPIFILDDVGSELDADRSEALFHTLLESSGQVFLTTTEPAKISNNFNIKGQAQGASFLVEEGKIRVLG